jgi:tRNA(Ile)-lysidine synthase
MAEGSRNPGKPRPLAFELAVRRTLARHAMLAPGERVLVAASAGADSTALLLALHRQAAALGIEVAAAHLDHRLRGAESAGDARFVADLCGRLGIPLVAEEIDVAAAAAASRGNLEETARDARRAFLERAARQTGASRVALGHTLDDQAETILMRLVRGSGTAGLAAIHPTVSGIFIRPLLETRRREVLAYLAVLGESWREDATNADFDFTRNRIRHEILPYLTRHLNPRAAEALARSAENVRLVADFLQAEGARVLGELRRPAPGGLALPAVDLRRLHPALAGEVVRQALAAARGSLRRITAAHLAGILDLTRPGRSGRRLELPGGSEVRRELDDLLILGRRAPASPTFQYALPVPGVVAVPEAGLEIVAALGTPGAVAAARGSRVWLDAAALPAGLVVRNRRPADVYGIGSAPKLKKVLLEARIPALVRGSIPVIASGAAVVWVPGLEAPTSLAAALCSPRAVLLEARLLGAGAPETEPGDGAVET